MKAVKISEFKAKLSKYLRLVKSGEEINILDRGEPVAKVTSMAKSSLSTLIRPPLKDPSALKTLKSKVTQSFVGDVVDLLLQDRNRR
jgi:prevent-host-death family protein